MYSVVLLMAMSGSVDTPSLGWGCKGCCGCCGYDCSGCSGCHGCCGGFKLFGCKGCCGGCHGCCGGDCHGCCGGCKGCFGGFKLFGGKGCCGGCHGCCGGCHGCCGGEIHHAAPVVVPHASVTMPKADAVVEGSAPATIIVNVPTETKLTIDGNSTSSTTERRVFVSPALEAGQEYYYTLKADLNGETKEQRVTVKAGQEVAVKIEFTPAVAAK